MKNETKTKQNYEIFNHEDKKELQKFLTKTEPVYKCSCKKSKFTRTVDSEFNPLCGGCGKPI